MASQKQIAANRANAQRSTGPKTAVGKMRSSRNSFRHGLSGPLPFDLASWSKVDAIARALKAEDAGATASSGAVEFATAHVQLLRIRAIRAEMLLRVVDLDSATEGPLQRVVALDRYERYADTRRRRASSNIESRMRGTT